MSPCELLLGDGLTMCQHEMPNGGHTACIPCPELGMKESKVHEQGAQRGADALPAVRIQRRGHGGFCEECPGAPSHKETARAASDSM